MSIFWNNKKQSKLISNFFEGKSFVINACKSLYGEFIDILKNTFNNNIIEKLNIPKIIVIGAESSGKSSLLESIIKCPIFPRNTTICTRQPIHVILRTANVNDEISYVIKHNDIIINIEKEEILQKITEIMSFIDGDNISSDEILITITELNMPNFEFYDLPGIIAYPEQIAIKTREITEYYLKQENIIIVCVIPATTPRITSYYPISLIQKYNKEKNTIIALTMADRVQNDNIYELLVKRIEYTTDEFSDLNFAGCVSVINRSHKDTQTLIENDKNEELWFINNILNDIPDNYDESLIAKIKNNIGIQNLIKNIDILYNNFIKDEWIPNTISQFKSDLIKNKLELVKLGVSDVYIKKNAISCDSYDFYDEEHQISKLYLIQYNNILDKICKFIDKDIFIDKITKKYNDDTRKTRKYLDYDDLLTLLNSHSLISSFDDINFIQIYNNDMYRWSNTNKHFINTIHIDDYNKKFDKIKDKMFIINNDYINCEIFEEEIKQKLNGNIYSESDILLFNNEFCNYTDNILNNNTFTSILLNNNMITMQPECDETTYKNTVQYKFDNEEIYDVMNENKYNYIYNINRFSEFNKEVICNIICDYNKFIFKEFNDIKKVMKYNCIMNNYSLKETVNIYYKFITNILSMHKEENYYDTYVIEDNLTENIDYQQKRQQISDNLINIANTMINLKKLKKNYE
jgi:hypothetical protein